jgi:homoserine O-succinyltransferase
MPVRIPNDLPARADLAKENIFTMTTNRARHQDIRPLRIAVLNLMPTKLVTETQLLRLLGNSPLQVDVTFVRLESHEARNTSSRHLETFYEPASKVLGERYDGLVITGAPVETMEFQDVDYWPELVRIMEWSTTNVWSTLHVCWGAQAGLFHRYGVQKNALPAKKFGIFRHRVVAPLEPVLRGFDEEFLAPHSRHTDVREADLRRVSDLRVLAVSDEAGLYMASGSGGRMIYVMGHPEYDRGSLKAEYERDVAKGLPIAVPVNYFPDDDPSREPVMSWRSHAHLLYANWLNYCVYQGTPYDLDDLSETKVNAADMQRTLPRP